MTMLYVLLAVAVVGCLIGSSLRKARQLAAVKGRPATFGDFHEPAVYHETYPIEDGIFLHHVKANGVAMEWRHADKHLEARPIWRDTPQGTVIGVELRDRDDVVIAEQWKLLDA